MLIVTHNIEEAVLLADRIFVLGSNPGRIRTEIAVAFSRPRDRHDEEFQRLVDDIYALMTGQGEGPPAHVPAEAGGVEQSPTSLPLPAATVGGLSGLLEILEAQGGRADLPALAQGLSFEVDDLLPLIDAGTLLGLADVHDADISLTETGRRFVTADIDTSKVIFARQSRERVPLIRAICNALGTTRDGTLDERFFLDLLRRGFSEEEAREQLDIAVDWGRYAELFDRDANSGQLRLEIALVDENGDPRTTTV
jgi:NitT/TauT family transport system ATP-binding protein